MAKSKIDFDEKFIQEVRKHPLIYNPALEDYKCQKKKDRAWQEISRRVNLNATLCRKRWKGLRDCYMRCKRTTKAGGKLKWKYYQPMSFLDSIKSSRRFAWNLPQDESTEKVVEDKSVDQGIMDESSTQAEHDETNTKSFDNFLKYEVGNIMEFTAEDYALPNVESPLPLETEHEEICFEEKLIEEVRLQTCLYDSSSSDYSNDMLKDRVWIDIAKRLNSSYDICRALWNTLLVTYTKNIQRAKLRCGAGAKLRKRKKYFEKMNFLDDYILQLPITANTGVIEKTENTDDFFIMELGEERTLNSNNLEIPNDFSQSLDPLDHSTSSEFSKTSGSKRKDDCLSESSVECQSKQSKRKDSTTLLFESLNENIKNAKLSAKQRLDIESSIASLVYAKLLSYSN